MPGVEIIIMTERLDDAKALAAIEAGAAGYILKNIPAANLVTALNSVRQGQVFFHPEITRKLIERVGHPAHGKPARLGPSPEGLTARELEVLVELTNGSTDRQIASKLTVSEGTVKTHIRNILQKLNVAAVDDELVARPAAHGHDHARARCADSHVSYLSLSVSRHAHPSFEGHLKAFPPIDLQGFWEALRPHSNDHLRCSDGYK